MKYKLSAYCSISENTVGSVEWLIVQWTCFYCMPKQIVHHNSCLNIVHSKLNDVTFSEVLKMTLATSWGVY